MNTYTIVLERIGTGKHALSMVTRQENEMAARAYAEAAIAQSPDLRVVAVYARPYDASPRLLRAAWLGVGVREQTSGYSARLTTCNDEPPQTDR
jgi:hypothetical protein